jgi:hypothetical protein
MGEEGSHTLASHFTLAAQRGSRLGGHTLGYRHVDPTGHLNSAAAMMSLHNS